MKTQGKISYGNDFCAEVLNYSEATPVGTGSAHDHYPCSEWISSQEAWWEYLLTAEKQESVAELLFVENCGKFSG